MSWYEEVEKRSTIVTPEILKISMPRAPKVDSWASAFDLALFQRGIDSPHDVAMFLAQVGHESADLTRLKESLWYSAERLVEVWPSRFPTLDSAYPYAENPEALANNVYGDRLGNVEPGDGFRFIGRGPIQLTGRYNYTRCQEATGLPLLERPELLATDPGFGTVSAVWYWSEHVTPGADIETATRQINGGLNGLDDRRERFLRTLRHMVE